MSTVCILQILFHYLSVLESLSSAICTASFGGGRSACACDAELGIGESGAVNVTILVARQPFLSVSCRSFSAEIEATRRHSPTTGFTSVGNRRWLSTSACSPYL